MKKAHKHTHRNSNSLKEGKTAINKTMYGGVQNFAVGEKKILFCRNVKHN